MAEPMIVGDFRIDGVLDGGGRSRPHKAFRSVDPEAWVPHRYLLDGDGLLPFSLGGYLVRDGDRVVLVDAGLGPAMILGLVGGHMIESLAALGVKPDDVTDVIFTHLHVDHIGWATRNGSVIFRNAIYRCSQADWQHFMVDTKDVSDDYPAAEGIPGNSHDHLLPATSRFETFTGTGDLLPGIDTIAAPGHTPGSSIIVISSDNERAMLLGDVVHCPVQLLDDEWEGLMDVDPALAKRTRNALARELEGTDVNVAAAHFPGLRFGRLLKAEGRRRFVF